MSVEKTALLIQALALQGPQTYAELSKALGTGIDRVRTTCGLLDALGIVDRTGRRPIPFGKPPHVVALAPRFMHGVSAQLMKTGAVIKKTNT